MGAHAGRLPLFVAFVLAGVPMYYITQRSIALPAWLCASYGVRFMLARADRATRARFLLSVRVGVGRARARAASGAGRFRVGGSRNGGRRNGDGAGAAVVAGRVAIVGVAMFLAGVAMLVVELRCTSDT
jgi:hypothetical protein